MTKSEARVENILRLNNVINRTGLSKSSIYAFIKANKFPKSISLGLRSVGWLESEINEWIIDRTYKSRD